MQSICETESYYVRIHYGYDLMVTIMGKLDVDVAFKMQIQDRCLKNVTKADIDTKLLNID